MSEGARYVEADRNQLRWDMIDLQGLLPADHLARVVWRFAEGLDLSVMYDRIQARDAQPGRPAADPRVVLALWLYATLEGIGSARALEKLCRSQVAYRWLCGGVPTNYHLLSDFRTAHADVLDGILTTSVAAMLSAGVVTLDEIVIDGTKVRANAGRGSYRTQKGIAGYRARAAAHVARLKAEIASDPAESEIRRRQAVLRAEREMEARAAAAQAKLAALQAEKNTRAQKYKKEEKNKPAPKASTTDVDARLMRMADGATRPAYNILVTIDAATQVVVGLQSTDRRNDTDMAIALLDEVRKRYGRARPARLLADTKMATQGDILALAPATIVYTPVPPDKEDAKPDTIRRREQRRAKEPEPLRSWRARMASEEAAAVYQRRMRIETVNASLKHRGARRFSLRGLAKIKCEALMIAIAHNIRRAHTLQPALA